MALLGEGGGGQLLAAVSMIMCLCTSEEKPAKRGMLKPKLPAGGFVLNLHHDSRSASTEVRARRSFPADIPVVRRCDYLPTLATLAHEELRISASALALLAFWNSLSWICHRYMPILGLQSSKPNCGYSPCAIGSAIKLT